MQATNRKQVQRHVDKLSMASNCSVEMEANACKQTCGHKQANAFSKGGTSAEQNWPAEQTIIFKKKALSSFPTFCPFCMLKNFLQNSQQLPRPDLTAKRQKLFTKSSFFSQFGAGGPKPSFCQVGSLLTHSRVHFVIVSLRTGIGLESRCDSCDAQTMRFVCPRSTSQKCTSEPRPHIQGESMNKNVDNIYDPKCFKISKLDSFGAIVLFIFFALCVRVEVSK